MNNKTTTTGKNAKTPLSEKSAAFIELLTQRGLIEDKQINDKVIREANMDMKRKMYHNTELMLQHYRDIMWVLECFPSNIAEELGKPLHNLDALLSHVSSEIGMDNRKLENRLKSISKTRVLIDHFNEALTILKKKPNGGQELYDILYNTYIIPEKLSHIDLLYRLDISTRHYYRLRKQAINILSIRLWTAPVGEMDSWLEVLTILESI